MTLFTRPSSSRVSDSLDIDSPVQPLTYTGKVSHPPGEWWVALTTNINTPLPDFNNPVMVPDEEDLNIS
jgi:hypothetical protein